MKNVMNQHDEIAVGTTSKALGRAGRVAALASLVAVLVPLASLPTPAAAASFSGSGSGAPIMTTGSLCGPTGPGAGMGTNYCGTFEIGTMSVASTITPLSGGGYSITYFVTSDGSGGDVDPYSIGCQQSADNGGYCSYVDGFSIPEFNFNDLVLTSLPSGWTTSQTYSPVFPGADVPGYAGSLVYLNVYFNSDYGYCQVHDDDSERCDVTEPPNNPIYTGGGFSFSTGAGSFVSGSVGFSSGQVDPDIYAPQGTDLTDLTVVFGVVPEPSELATLGIGLAALLGARRRKKR